jgi:Ni/Co efflux regulator RcnB
MKKTIVAGVISSALMMVQPFAIKAQHPDDSHGPAPHSYVKHSEWRKGAKIQQNDWNRGAQVDYRSHHLNAPPRGYEWREVDGNYVLAAVATGIIASVIVDSAAR